MSFNLWSLIPAHYLYPKTRFTKLSGSDIQQNCKYLQTDTCIRMHLKKQAKFKQVKKAY
jgi:hypothetical protein